MTAQTGNSWKIIFEPVNGEDSALLSFFEEYFNVLSIDYDDDGNEVYSAYTASEPKHEDIDNAALAWNIKLPKYKTEFIPATDWLAKNIIEFAPIETDTFIIYGSHEEKIPDINGKTALRIYAATAFGSGQHQTTKSCLNLMNYLNEKNIKPNNILDMGCGSGILSLSALKLWNSSSAIAADIDNEAVLVTLRNAADNKLSGRISSFRSNGYENPEIKKNAPYDLIVSNILARPLIDMAPQLYQNLKPGGYAIISGFTDDQTEWVVGEYEKNNFKPLKVYEDENWRAVLLEKTR